RQFRASFPPLLRRRRLSRSRLAFIPRRVTITGAGRVTLGLAPIVPLLKPERCSGEECGGAPRLPFAAAMRRLPQRLTDSPNGNSRKRLPKILPLLGERASSFCNCMVPVGVRAGLGSHWAAVRASFFQLQRYGFS